MDNSIEESKPTPFISLERYRLVLYHEKLVEGNTIQLDLPACFTYTMSPYVINYDQANVLAHMIKEFENQILLVLGERYKNAACSSDRV